MFRTILIVAALSIAAGPAIAQSQDPIQQLLANFDRIDSDGDGVISRAEFRTVQAARWSLIDRNHDGYLTEDDFPPVATRRARIQLAEIGYLDTDGDGRISQGEFLGDPAPVFRRADLNADGALTLAELETVSG